MLFRLLFYISLLIFTLFNTVYSPIVAAAQNKLQNIHIATPVDNNSPARISLSFDHAVDYKVFTLQNPQRLVIDIKNCHAVIKANQVNIAANNPINHLRMGIQNGMDLRVVFDLKQTIKPNAFTMPSANGAGQQLVIDCNSVQPFAAASASGNNFAASGNSLSSAAVNSNTVKKSIKTSEITSSPQPDLSENTIPNNTQNSQALAQQIKSVPINNSERSAAEAAIAEYYATHPAQAADNAPAVQDQDINVTANNINSMQNNSNNPTPNNINATINADQQNKIQHTRTRENVTAENNSSTSQSQQNYTNDASLVSQAEANANAAKQYAQLTNPASPDNSNIFDDASALIPAVVKGNRPVIVVIDAGHGGKDPGASGPLGIHEKNVTLAIAEDLEQLVNKQHGMHAVMTRNSDYYVGLRDRLMIARKDKGDIFIAIHADAAPAFASGAATGASVFALSLHGASSEAARWVAEKENYSELSGIDLDNIPDQDNVLRSVLIDLSQTATISDSLILGHAVLHQLSLLSPLHHDVVEQAPFMVLKSPDIPSILVETGFITNSREEDRLSNPVYQQELAQAMLAGIKNYFVHYAPPGTWLASHKASQAQL